MNGAKKKSKEKFKKCIKTNENGNTTYQSPQDTAKAAERGKFSMINAYMKELERSEIKIKLYTSRTQPKKKKLRPELGEVRK